jgi:hypothetical protein
MNTETNTIETKKATRTQAFSRDFNKGAFDGLITLSPNEELAKAGVKSMSFDASVVPGVSALPKSSRVIYLRSVADALSKTFADCVKSDRDNPDGGSYTEATDEMSDCFASILNDTFEFGRTGSGVGKMQGVALTAALLVAAQYGLPDRATATAHPTYLTIMAKLQAMQKQAADAQALADAVVVPVDPDGSATPEVLAAITAAQAEQDKHSTVAGAFRSAYMQIAKADKIRDIRLAWYPPKAKTDKAPIVSIDSLFEGV